MAHSGLILGLDQDLHWLNFSRNHAQKINDRGKSTKPVDIAVVRSTAGVGQAYGEGYALSLKKEWLFSLDEAKVKGSWGTKCNLLNYSLSIFLLEILPVVCRFVSYVEIQR